jgi:hypothetical protein
MYTAYMAAYEGEIINDKENIVQEVSKRNVYVI